jgi:hypothetical protein
VPLDHGPHGAVEHEDALLEGPLERFQAGGTVGEGLVHGIFLAAS